MYNIKRTHHKINTSPEQKVTAQHIKKSVSTFAPVDGVPEEKYTNYRVSTDI